MDEFDFIYRYEVDKIINNNINIVGVGNDLESINTIYEKTVKNYENSEYHVIVNLYDAEKNTNINSYDNELDIC